jgi:hypothetical protein
MSKKMKKWIGTHAIVVEPIVFDLTFSRRNLLISRWPFRVCIQGAVRVIILLERNDPHLGHVSFLGSRRMRCGLELA